MKVRVLVCSGSLSTCPLVPGSDKGRNLGTGPTSCMVGGLPCDHCCIIGAGVGSWRPVFASRLGLDVKLQAC